ncbi:MAG TPA: hypothetical protein VF406_15845 [Thermodesulfobacteriota bacterium]
MLHVDRFASQVTGRWRWAVAEPADPPETAVGEALVARIVRPAERGRPA